LLLRQSAETEPARSAHGRWTRVCNLRGNERLKALVYADIEFHAMIGAASRNQFLLSAMLQNVLRRLIKHLANLFHFRRASRDPPCSGSW